MKEFISNLFGQNGFIVSDGNGIKLFSYGSEANKKVYWVLIERDSLDILPEQSEIFSACKALNKQPEMDKNISLIVLIKLTDKQSVRMAKPQILKIEENAFYFKKYVLYYTDAEYQQLLVNKGDKSELEFITYQITHVDCFKVYKANPQDLNWQSLVYRMTLKFPFIPVPIKTNKGLASLFEDNKVKLATKRFTELDDKLVELYNPMAINEINNLTPSEILAKLISTVK